MSIMTQVGLEFIARDSSRSGINSFKGNLAMTGQSIRSLASNVMAFAGIGGGLYMLQRGFKQVISESSKAQETLAKFNTVFAGQEGEAAQWAESFGNSVGRSTQDVEEWMAGLQDTFVPLGIARDKAAELSESLVKLAVDVASFNNKADAEVIRDFTSALIGNHETVRKYGIIISESAIKQELLNKSFKKTFAELTDLEKVQLRYALIEKGTSDAQGDAIRTGDSYANQIKRLQANYSELSVTIGNEMLPAIAEMISSLNEFLQQGDRAANTIKRITGAMETYWKWYSGFLKHTPGGWALGKLYGSLASPVSESHLLPSKELMGRAPAESEEATLNRRLQEVYAAPAAGPDVAKAAADRVQITARMYSDMGQLSDGYYQSQVALLDRQKEEYGQFITDKVLLEQWYAGEMNKIQEEIQDAVQKQEQEALQKQADIAMQYLSLWDRAMKQRKEIWLNGLTEIEAAERDKMDIMMRYMDDTKTSWVHMWDPFIDGSKSASEAVSAFFRDFLIRLLQAKMQMIMLNLWGGFGGIFGGIGGVVLHSGWVPEGVPSFQGGRGLKSNEMAAIIEKDELLAPAGQVIRSPFSRGGSAPNVIIYNESGQQIEQKAPPQFDGEKWVVALVAKNISQGGSLSKLMKK